MKSYLLLYNNEFGSEKKIVDFIDKQSEILNWHTTLPSSVFIVSKKNLTTLSAIFHHEFKDGMFIIVPINERQIDGLLTAESWEFITNPKPYEDE